MNIFRSMGKIKSAWEIALEKTRDISMDKDKLHAMEQLEKARRAIGAYLNDDDTKEEDLEAVLSSTEASERQEALKKAILSAISLSMSPDDTAIWQKLKKLASLASDDPDIPAFLDQIATYIRQYPEHRKSLLEKLKAQFQPMLEEKEQELSRKYGQDVHLSLDSDKEFIQIATQNLKQLDQQYDAAVQNAKDELGRIITG